MPIKRLAIKGISRTPSDRAVQDGGCDESLNVQIKDGEVCPIIPAKDRTNEYLGQNSTEDQIYYIHKHNDYENVIVVHRGFTMGDAIIPSPYGDKDPNGEYIYRLVFQDDIVNIEETGPSPVGNPTYMIEIPVPGSDGYVDYFIVDFGRGPVLIANSDPDGSAIGTNGSVYTFRTEEILTLEHERLSANTIAYNSRTGLTILKDIGEEVIKDITSLGNTLIVSHSGGTEYFLFSNGAYKYLGNHIPFPELTIGRQSFVSIDDYLYYSPQSSEYQTVFNLAHFNLPKSIEYDTTNGLYRYAMEAKEFAPVLRAFLNDQEKLAQGYTSPVLVRYALVLYDGCEIYSEPLLYFSQPGESQHRVRILAETRFVGSGVNLNSTTWSYTKFTFQGSAMRLKLQQINTPLNDSLGESWKDIVKSIRVYMSEDLYEYNDTVTGCELVGRKQDENRITGTIYLDKGIPSKDAIESKYVFYEVTEVSLDYFLANPTIFIDYVNNEERVTKRMLKESTVNGRNQVSGHNLLTYNNRLIVSDSRITYCDGPASYPGQKPYPQSAIQFLKLNYYLQEQNGNAIISRRISLVEPNVNGSVTPLSYLVYPSALCKKVVMEVTKGQDLCYYEFTMREHPFLDVAYYYNERYPMLQDLINAVDSGAFIQTVSKLDSYTPPKEQRTLAFPNRVYMSEVNNFYIFTNDITLSGTVRSIQLATQALSQGQFGQYPLMVFTDDGIWAVPIDEQGRFAQIKPFSRDVLSGDAVSLDQPIVYCTKDAVKILNGSESVELSTYMVGEPYHPDDALVSNLRYHTEANLITAISEADDFINFISSSKICYDSMSKRIIFFNTESPVALTMTLGDLSWHKMTLPSGLDFKRILNSYPESLVVLANRDGKEKIFDFSSALSDVSDLHETDCLIITRPFNLEEPDVLKTIKHIRIRGQYEKRDEDGVPRVSYLLQGSNDDARWFTLSSLRGKSWKMYRMIILAKLKKHERISYVDIDYESRFTNKLR